MLNKILVVVADFTDNLEDRKFGFDTSLDEYDELNYFAARSDSEIMKVTRNEFADKAALKKRILAISPTCIFNKFEGFDDDSNSEIEFAKLLEEIGIPFTGNTADTLGPMP